MNELTVEYTSQFRRDYKLAMRRHLDVAELDAVIIKLAHREPLPAKNKDHALHNNWEGFRLSCIIGHGRRNEERRTSLLSAT